MLQEQLKQTNNESRPDGEFIPMSPEVRAQHEAAAARNTINTLGNTGIATSSITEEQLATESEPSTTQEIMANYPEELVKLARYVEIYRIDAMKNGTNQKKR